MTRMWRNSLEAAEAVGMVVLATLIVHLVTSWWSASAALHRAPWNQMTRQALGIQNVHHSNFAAPQDGGRHFFDIGWRERPTKTWLAK